MSSKSLHTKSHTGKAYWGPGDMYEVLVTGEESGGTHFAMEAFVPVGAGPPPHIHHNEDETFYILEGECTIMLGGEKIVAGPGDFVNLPRDVEHAFVNEGPEPLRMVMTFLPAGIEKYFEEVFDVAEDRTATPPPVSEELIGRLLSAAPKYGIEFKLPK